MDITATLIDAGGQRPDEAYPLDGRSLLPWLPEGAPEPEGNLLWRTREQGAVRRGRFKLLYDRQAKPLWGRSFAKEGPRVRLFDITVDGREKADLSSEFPELTQELLETWQEFDAALLPYPCVHPDDLAEAQGRPD
jgi:arylsulfatase A-like enzyme